MEEKKKVGLQIRFNHESEQDVIEFFSTIKKPEVHITAISAFRMYMRSVGFYEKRWLDNNVLQDLLNQHQNGQSSKPKAVGNAEKEGLFDENEFKIFDSMFDEENRLKN
jgi:hypothetical protein